MSSRSVSVGLVIIGLVTPISLGASVDRADLRLDPWRGIEAAVAGPNDPLARPVSGPAPPGLGVLDPWVDANGDAMFGNLMMGEFEIAFSNGMLSGSSAAPGLRFAGLEVCTAGSALCVGATGPAGPQGPQGEQGEPGPPGPSGATNGWIDDGAIVRLLDGVDRVGVGTGTPTHQFVVGTGETQFVNDDFMIIGTDEVQAGVAAVVKNKATVIWADDRLDSDGVQGFGLTAYDYATASRLPFSIGWSATPDVADMHFDGTGRVGVGTNSPGARLSVAGDLAIVGTTHGLASIRNTATKEADIGYSVDGIGSWEVGMGYPDSIFGQDAFFFFTDNNEKMSLDSDGDLFVRGNIGVGRTAPQARLDVAGGIGFDGQKVCRVGLQGLATSILVPATWSKDTCEAWAAMEGGLDAWYVCIFADSFSIAASGGTVPNPNCGW